LIYEKKADTKYKPVQAAAILAKVTRDKAIKDLGYSNISGYPNTTTNKFIIEYFLHNKTLPKGIRLRWKNIKKLLNYPI
jgi:ribonuclease HII